MARITVEDCLQNVKNRFELVLLAAKRARLLMRGTVEPKVQWENDKATVVALREIAAGYKNLTDVPNLHTPELLLIEKEDVVIIPTSPASVPTVTPPDVE